MITNPPNPNFDLERCWFGLYGHPSDRCPERGTWGWTKAAADKAGASKGSVLRISRWCPAHKHYDDQLLPEDTQ